MKEVRRNGITVLQNNQTVTVRGSREKAFLFQEIIQRDWPLNGSPKTAPVLYPEYEKHKLGHISQTLKAVLC